MLKNLTFQELIDKAELCNTSNEELSEIFQDLGSRLRDPSLRSLSPLRSSLPKTLKLFNKLSESKKDYGLQAKIIRYLVNLIADNNDNRELLISQDLVSTSFFKSISETLLLNESIISQDEDKNLLILYVLHLLQNLIIDNTKAIEFIRSFEDELLITNIIKASHSLTNSEDNSEEEEENPIFLDLLLELLNYTQSGKFYWVELIVNYLEKSLPRTNTTLRCQIGFLENLTKQEELKFTNSDIQNTISKLFKIFSFLKTDDRHLWQDDDNEEENMDDQQMVWEKWLYIIMNLSANKNNLNDKLLDYAKLLDETNNDIESKTPNYAVYIMMSNFITSREKRDEFYNLVKGTNVLELYHEDILACLTCENVAVREPILLQSFVLANKLLLIGDYAKKFIIKSVVSGLSCVPQLRNDISLITISKYLQSLQVNNIIIDEPTKHSIFIFVSSIEMNFKNYQGVNLIGLNLINYMIINNIYKLDEIQEILRKINHSMDRLELDLIVEKSKTMGLLLSNQELITMATTNEWFTKSFDELRSMVDNDQFKQQGGNPILLNNYKFINSKLGL